MAEARIVEAPASRCAGRSTERQPGRFFGRATRPRKPPASISSKQKAAPSPLPRDRHVHGQMRRGSCPPKNKETPARTAECPAHKFHEDLPGRRAADAPPLPTG